MTVIQQSDAKFCNCRKEFTFTTFESLNFLELIIPPINIHQLYSNDEYKSKEIQKNTSRTNKVFLSIFQ